MYSLYRAWLSLGPGAAGLSSTLPPDIHQATCATFGYNPQHSSSSSSNNSSNGSPDVTLQVGPSMTHFSAHKTILSAHSGFFKAVFLNHTGSNPISVPNVNVDEFSSLLTFMYTGFLDLNFGNIYNILLATHILHMPRALEICRSFLIQNHPLEAATVAAATAAAGSGGGVSNIIKPIPSRKSVLPHQQIFPPLFGSNHLQKSEATPFRTIEKQPSDATKSTTVTEAEPPPRKIVSSTVIEQKKSAAPEKVKLKKREEASATNNGGSGSSSGNTEKVVVDVACCDGPVRFHRVLNKNYGLKNVENNFRVEEIDRNVLMNKVMHENIRDKQIETENQMQSVSSGGTNGGNDMFTCVYCNHTFKSQYCYQKHARRHLNPVNLEVKSIQKVENFVSNKREVKLLDMNVQYYPCKTCGSKFPSYYFVHKHRKLCHADEIGDGSVRSTENPEKSNNESNSDSVDTKNNEDSEIEVGNEN